MAREGLTEKQRRFVEAYAETANATESARRAGYKGDDNTLAVTGARLLRNTKVASGLQKLTEPLHAAAIMSAQERQAWLTAIARGEVPEVYLVDGVPMEGPARLKERLSAADQLNKMQSSYTEKREVEHKGAAVQVYLPSNDRD